MSLRIRRLKLVVDTPAGPYGTDLSFGDGLVLLNLDNSRGKSTALKAIIYALGLERMFGPVAKPPLTPALSAALKDELGQELRVIESRVFLEIENHDKKRLTIRRKIAGQGQDWRIVDVWDGTITDE